MEEEKPKVDLMGKPEEEKKGKEINLLEILIDALKEKESGGKQKLVEAMA